MLRLVKIAGGTDVTIFLRVRKSEISLNSFVKISAKFCLEPIWRIDTNLLSTDSLMAFSRIAICRRPLVVVFLDQQTQAVLSLNSSIGLDVGM